MYLFAPMNPRAERCRPTSDDKHRLLKRYTNSRGERNKQMEARAVHYAKAMTSCRALTTCTFTAVSASQAKSGFIKPRNVTPSATKAINTQKCIQLNSALTMPFKLSCFWRIESTSACIHEPSANDRSSSIRSTSTRLTETSGTLSSTDIPKASTRSKNLRARWSRFCRADRRVVDGSLDWLHTESLSIWLHKRANKRCCSDRWFQSLPSVLA